MKKEYSVFILKGAKFLLLLLLVDFLFGTVSQYIFNLQKSGKYARSTYVINESLDDIIIMGSSHAIRHYIPEIFEENLNKSCYNAGAEGQQLIYQLALEKLILKRRKPKLIVLNIDEDWLYKSTIAYERLSDLHPYYSENKEIFNPIFSRNTKFVNLKFLFSTYKTNSTILHILKYSLLPQVDYKGYRPLYGKIDSIDHGVAIKSDGEIDENFRRDLTAFITLAKENDVPLVFTTSPLPYTIDLTKSKSFKTVKHIAKNENIPLLNFYTATEFIGKYDLFHDNSHLNNDGAILFSKLICDEIISKKYIY